MYQIKPKSPLLLACGLALVLLPGAYAAHKPEHTQATHDAMFKAMDTNGDGQLSRTENAAGSAKMFTDTDTSHDGQVTLAEMTASHAKMAGDMPAKTDMPMKADKPRTAGNGNMHGMSPADMIKSHDKNNDGQVSTAEHTKACDEMFTKMDANKDGWLSPAECVEGSKMMKTTS